MYVLHLRVSWGGRWEILHLADVWLMQFGDHPWKHPALVKLPSVGCPGVFCLLESSRTEWGDQTCPGRRDLRTREVSVAVQKGGPAGLRLQMQAGLLSRPFIRILVTGV